MATPYLVREGTEKDLDELHRLMQESKSSGTNETPVTPSVETLRTYGFTEPTYFQFFVAVNPADQGEASSCGENTSLVGYLLFCQSFSSEVGKIINLKDLYVTPGCRRKGAAKEMWKSHVKAGNRASYRMPDIHPLFHTLKPRDLSTTSTACLSAVFAMAGEFQRVQLSDKNADPELIQYLQNYELTDLIQKEGWCIFNMNKTAIEAVK